MKAYKSFLLRWGPILAVAVSVPFVVVGNVSIRSNTADVSHWLPKGQQARVAYDEFVTRFGSDDFLVISWPGCTLDDPRVERLYSALEQLTQETDDGPPQFARVLSGPSFINRLTSKPAELSLGDALDRAKGVLVGSDRSSTCVVAELTEAGRLKKKEALETVIAIAREECELDRDSLRMGGSVYEAVVIDETSSRSLDRYSGPSLLVGLVIAIWCLRSARLTIIVIVTALYCRCLAIALLYYTQGHLNAVLIVMPTLIYVLTISGAIHLVNYYQEGLLGHGSRDAVKHALKVGWLPCLLAATSTAIGLSSLGVSRIEPIRTFGYYSSAGLMLSLLVLLTFLPAMLSVWRAREKDLSDAKLRFDTPDSVTLGRTGRVFINQVLKHRTVVTLGGLAVLVFSAFGLMRTTTSIKFERMFRPHSEIIRNYGWLEEHLGPLVPIEVVVQLDEDAPMSTLDRIELIREMSAAIRDIPGAGGTMSAAVFCPDAPPVTAVRAGLRRRVVDRRVTKRLHEFVDAGYLAVEQGTQYWRITARSPALDDLNNAQFIEQVRTRVDGVLQSKEAAEREAVVVNYTGLSPMIFEAQRQMLDDLVNSFMTAFLLISIVMMVVLRGVVAGLLSMIPNVVPTLLVFGIMGWASVSIDIGSVMCGSVALGIAIDGTLHFLTWYKRGVHEGRPSPLAVRFAFERCAPAMFQTTLVCGAAILVFAFSEFVPTSRFAWLMCLLLWAALLGDLIILPALLAGPLGRFFARGAVVEQVAGSIGQPDAGESHPTREEPRTGS